MSHLQILYLNDGEPPVGAVAESIEDVSIGFRSCNKEWYFFFGSFFFTEEIKTVDKKVDQLVTYQNCRNFMRANYGDRIDGQSFYEYVFPDNEISGELNSDYSKPNAVYLYQPDPESKKPKRRIMLKDTWENDYIEYVCDNTMTLCSGLAYRGRTNQLEHAQQMNALIFDIDGVGLAQLRTILARTEIAAEQIRSIPIPTFLVLSGTGVHLYYVFDEPISLFPYIKLQLQSLKHDLTTRIWDFRATSTYKNIQYQGINQAFRMVGSINNKYGTEVVAYQTGELVTLDYLNAYVEPKSRVDIQKRFRPAKMTKAEAAEKFPEWYENKVVKKKEKPPKWDISGKVHGDDPYALYHWWLRQVDKVKGGHRYFFMMNAAIYACKCNVPKRKLQDDLGRIYEILRKIPHVDENGRQDELSEQDIHIAMKAYSKEYYCFKLKDHIDTSGIDIPRNKRNRRKQAAHIKIMNFVRDEVMEKRDWRNKDGRPTAQQKVIEWRREHPEGRKIDCERETGMSRHTILKWWETTIEKKEETIKYEPDFIITTEDRSQIVIEAERTNLKEDQKQRIDFYRRGLEKYLGKKED